MRSNKKNGTREDGLETRERIKLAARKLFSEHGVENVTVRQIMTAAGQRHVGAVTYYFSSKEALAEEILSDVAKIVDTYRNRQLDKLESQKKPITVRDIISLMIKSSLIPSENGEYEFIRFFAAFTLQNRNIFLKAVTNQNNRGYERCIEHLRKLLPDIPRPRLNEYILSMVLTIGNCLGAREAALQQSKDSESVMGAAILRSPNYVESLTDFCIGGLCGLPQQNWPDN